MILRLTVRRNNYKKLNIPNIDIHTGTCIREYLVFIILLLPAGIFAVNDNYPSGARASALSGAGVALTGLWSSYHNQAGLAHVEKLMIGFHYENRYVVDEYGLHALALAVPVNWGTLGVNAVFFGYSKYNETKIALAYSRKFGERFSAGIQMDLLNVYQAEEYGSSAALAVEAGILTEPVDDLFIGAHVYNPTNSSFSSGDLSDVPVIFQAGIGYYFTEKVFITAETEKDTGHKAVFQGGIEYNIIKNIFARLGLSSHEMSSYSFGVGFVHKGIDADMAFSHHQILGYTPHVSFSYSFR